MSIPVKPIPGTFFEWEDQSDITTPDISATYTNPLFCAVFTSDKGKETWQRLSGQEWFNMYAVNGVVDYFKHGQPLLQTAMAINAGAEILCKRVCADDAALANLVVCATITAVTAPEGEGTAQTLVTRSKITYSFKSVEECLTKKEAHDSIQEAIDVDIAAIEAEQKAISGNTVTVQGHNVHVVNTTLNKTTDITMYALWTIADNGRGTSRKRIRIIPNYQLSKNYTNFFLYDFQLIEGTTTFDTIHFCLNPDTVSNGSNISLQYQINTKSNQLESLQFHDDLVAFINRVISLNFVKEETTGGGYQLRPMTYEEGICLDLLFCKNKKGTEFEYIKVDTSETGGVDLSIVGGTVLLNGSNGSFGDAPYSVEDTSLYAKQVAKAFAGYYLDGSVPKILTHAEGCFDPIIYNVDRYKIDAVFDANYPNFVKRAIEQLVTFREDFMYFRDMGTTHNTIALIKEEDYNNLHSMFCSTYCTYYDVIDPYTKKQITVTMMYHFIQKAVSQFNNGRNLPLAGIKYGFAISDVIEDTIQFIPSIVPGLNEKEELVDMRINYATFIDNQLVIETLFTSQDKYSQLSFNNNILAVQEVIKAIRTFCPTARYSFIDGSDLAKYKADVESYIDRYSANFKSLKLEYIEDAYYTQNKIFYAALAVQFRDFVQTELFKITALNSSETV